MKVMKLCLAALLVGNSVAASAATTYYYSTTISSLSIQLPESQTFPQPDPTPKPRTIISVPTPPSPCAPSVVYPFILTDLTDQAQKQIYATLLTAKINGLSVNIGYQVEGNMFRCRVVGVQF